MQKIVVRGTNWIGDAVMTIPALRSLRASFPDAEISLLTRSWADGVFRDAGFIDRILSFSPSGSRRRDLREERRLLKTEGFDAGILFTNSFASALALGFGKVERRFGYATEGRKFLLTDPIDVPPWKSERHEVNYYLNLVAEAARRLGRELPPTEPDITLPVSPQRRAAARAMIDEAGANAAAPLVVFGAGSTNSTAKRWPAESYAALGDLLSTGLGCQVVLLGSPDEKIVAGQVSDRANVKPIDLSGKTSLAEAVAILSVADLMVSNDMGLAHVARAVGTETIVIFGPTDDRTTRPIGSHVIRKPFDCAPCMLRECPIDHRCMTSIKPSEVFERAAEIVHKIGR